MATETKNKDNVPVVAKNLRRAITGLLGKIKSVENALDDFISEKFTRVVDGISEEMLNAQSATASQADFMGHVFYRILPRTVAQGGELTVCSSLGAGKRVWSERLRAFIYFDSTKLVTDTAMTEAVLEQGDVALLMDDEGRVRVYEVRNGTIAEQGLDGAADVSVWPLKTVMKETAEEMAAKSLAERCRHVDGLVRESYLTAEGKAALLQHFGGRGNVVLISDESRMYTIAERVSDEGGSVLQIVTAPISGSTIYYTDQNTASFPSANSFLWKSGLYVYDADNESFRNLGTHGGLVNGVYAD